MEKFDNKPATCRFCTENLKEVDYKSVILLRKHINTVGKILPPKRTGTCAKHQRMVATAIKRSRILGLLPFAAK